MINVMEFDLRALLEIEGGKPAAAIKLALKRIESDLNDRPALTDARKLQIELTFKPRIDSNGVGGPVTCDGADMKFKLKTVVPHQESGNIQLGMGVEGLTVNVDSPGNVDQHTMDYGDEKEVREVE